MSRKAKVVESWRQLGGGMRYLVKVGGYEVCVDWEPEGKLSGFVRHHVLADEMDLIRAAIACVRAGEEDEG